MLKPLTALLKNGRPLLFSTKAPGSCSWAKRRRISSGVSQMCPTCLQYLNLRKMDAEDPTLGNWPARDWPTTELLESFRRRYPEPMFETSDDLLAAATDRETEEEIYQASIVWRMEPERVSR
jgi:hypothetical protein